MSKATYAGIALKESEIAFIQNIIKQGNYDSISLIDTDLSGGGYYDVTSHDRYKDLIGDEEQIRDIVDLLSYELEFLNPEHIRMI